MRSYYDAGTLTDLTYIVAWIGEGDGQSPIAPGQSFLVYATAGSISKCLTTANIEASTNSNINYFAGACNTGSTTFKCFYGANVTLTAYGSAYTPEESAAEAKAEIELYSEDFLCDTLSRKKDVWNITGKGLPTLVWENP